MFQPELLYKFNELRQTELRQEAEILRLLHTRQEASCAVAQLVRQLSFRLDHWVITLSFIHETRLTDEAY